MPLELDPKPRTVVGITTDSFESLGSILVTDKRNRWVSSYDHNGGDGRVVTKFEDLLMPVAVDDEHMYWYSNMFQGLYRAQKHVRSEPQLLARDIGWVGDFKIAVQHGKGERNMYVMGSGGVLCMLLIIFLVTV